MIEWSWDTAIPIPIAMPAMTDRTASLKLSEDAVIEVLLKVFPGWFVFVFTTTERTMSDVWKITTNIRGY
jgi:hypothetical protein